MEIHHLRALVSDDFEAVNTLIIDKIQSQISLIDDLTNHIVGGGGKRLRPLLVLLASHACGYTGKDHIILATMVEFFHTATLLHDDVVDEADERRGFFSINALWKNKIAVLVGDYLLSKGLLLSLNHKDHQILQILSEAVKLMSEGELLQIEKSRKLNLDESVYYDIINGKTASLLASACAAGASSTFESPEQIEKMRLFGEKVGMAFQIKDDLFDYGNKNVGKPTGNDIKEKKLTLPLIYALNNCEASVKKKIIYIIKNQNTQKEKVDFVIDQVQLLGGIDYATQKMVAFRDEALAILHTFEPSDVREALEELVRYTTDREY